MQLKLLVVLICQPLLYLASSIYLVFAFCCCCCLPFAKLRSFRSAQEKFHCRLLSSSPSSTFLLFCFLLLTPYSLLLMWVAASLGCLPPCAVHSNENLRLSPSLSLYLYFSFDFCMCMRVCGALV